jgi:hypothetical protein
MSDDVSMLAGIGLAACVLVACLIAAFHDPED